MKLPEKYMDAMDECACSIIQKISKGQEISETDINFLDFYEKRIYNSQTVPMTSRLMKIFKKGIEIYKDFNKNNNEEIEFEEFENDDFE